MDTVITARNLGVTDRFREYAEEKAQKVEALAERAIALEVKLSRHRETRGSTGDDRVELTLLGPGPAVRAEASGADKYVAFDLAFAKLLERIRQAKDRRKVHRGQHRPTSLREAAGSEFLGLDIVPVDAEVLQAVRTGQIPVVGEAQQDDEEGYCPVVIREKVFATTRMTVDDALYYMELVGHDFYLFIDRDSGRPSVVYRRKGWDYGVIALDTEAEEHQEVATALRAVR
ncbi:MAG: ribosome-associated translation inhibitor RaiA [Microbacteriaceae bacterium]